MPFDEKLLEEVEEKPSGFDEKLLEPLDEEEDLTAPPAAPAAPAVPKPTSGDLLAGFAKGARMAYMMTPMGLPLLARTGLAKAAESPLVPPYLAPALKQTEEDISKPFLQIAKPIEDAQVISDAAQVMNSTTGLEWLQAAFSGDARDKLMDKLGEIQSQPPGALSKIFAGTQQAAAGGVNFFTSPLGVATLGSAGLSKGAQQAISLAFTKQMIESYPEQYKQLMEGIQQNDLTKISAALAGAGLNAAFIRQGIKTATAAAPPGAPAPTTGEGLPIGPQPRPVRGAALPMPPGSIRGLVPPEPVEPGVLTPEQAALNLQRMQREAGGGPELRPEKQPPIVPETPPEPERAMNVIQEIRAKGLDTKEKIRSVFPQLSREEAALYRDQAFPKEKGPADARRVEEAAKVYGDLRPQPEQGPPQVPVEEGGPGVQPQAPPGVQPAEIVLSEHGKPVFAELQRLAASGAEGWGTADALDLGDQLKNPEDIAAVKKWVEQKRAEIRNQIASLPKTIQTMGQKGRLAVLSQKLQEVIEGAEKPADKSHVQRHFAERAHPKLAGIEFQPENWRVTITAPEVYGAKGEKTPGSAQYDLVESGKNIDSASPEAMKGLGHDVPTREELMKLPSGRYTFAEAKAKLAELAKKGGEKIEEEKRPKEGVLAPEPSAPAPSPAPAAAAPETAAPPGVPVPAAPAPAVPGSMEEIANLRRAIFTDVGQTYRVYLKKATPEEVQSKLWLISDALTKVESLIDRLKKEGKPLGILVDTKQSLYSFKEVLQKSKKSRAPAPPPATPAAPAPAPPAPAEPTPAAPQDLKAVWEQFDGTGEIETARDLADHVERLISEGKAPQSLQGAVDAYREALREDFEEMGGRGDTETAEEEFTEAVRSAAGRTPPSPKPPSPAPEPPAAPAPAAAAPEPPKETPAEQAAKMPPPPPGLEKLSKDIRKAANAHQKALNDLEAHKLTEPPEGAPGQEVVEHNRTRIALAAGERKAEAAYNAALSEYSLAKWRASVPKSAFTPSKPRPEMTKGRPPPMRRSMSWICGT